MTTNREKLALYLGIICTIIPGMMLSGFLPGADVLPLLGWLGIAAGGAAIAGAIATPRWLRGAIAGALIGIGVLVGLLLYIELRTMILNSDTFLRLEIAIGAGLGAIPGFILFATWAKAEA
ncbi:MAG: hypothetical protein F6K30_10960 [Cyanothece sp. SIO2G6]|nr:hypothetical protein [Cyanothece sp. SIO2G6]